MHRASIGQYAASPLGGFWRHPVPTLGYLSRVYRLVISWACDTRHTSFLSSHLRATGPNQLWLPLVTGQANHR